MKHFYSSLTSIFQRSAMAAATVLLGVGVAMAVDGADEEVSGDEEVQAPDPVELTVIPDDSEVIARVGLERVIIMSEEGTGIMPTWNDDLMITLTNEKGTRLASWSNEEVLAGAVKEEDNDDNLGYVINVAEHITDGGVYTLTIPAGMFSVTLDAEEGIYADNAEAVLEYNVIMEPYVEISILPEPGVAIAKVALEETKIFYDGDTEITTTNKDDLYITLTNAMGFTLAQLNYLEVIEDAIRDDEEVALGYSIDFAKYITDNGVYTVTVPKGFFSIHLADGTYPENAELVAEYTVEEVGGAVALSINPEAGPVILDALKEVRLTANGEELMPIWAEDLYITLTNEMGIVMAQWDGDEAMDGAYMDYEEEFVEGIELDLAQYITDGGIYSLNVPEGFFKVGEDAVNATLLVEYRVSTTTALTVTPAAGDVSLVDLQEVRLNANGEEIMPTWVEELYITLTNANGVVIAQWDGDEAMDGAYMDYEEEFVEGIELDLAQYITDAGVYTLNVPAGFFAVGEGVVNAALAVEYNVSGVVVLTVTPDAGAVTRAQLKEIRLTANGQEMMPTWAEDLYITLTNAMGVVIAQWSGDEAMDGAYMDYEEEYVEGIELDLAQYITDGGVYTLNVPAGFFAVGEGNVNATVLVEYRVANVVELTLNPAAGVVLPEALKEVRLTAEGEEIMPTWAEDLYITLTNAMGAVIAQWSGDEAMDGAYMDYEEEYVEGIELDLAQYITDGGVYTLNVPEGFFAVGEDAVNAAIVAEYNVPNLYEITVTPEEGAVEIEDVEAVTIKANGLGIMPTFAEDLHITLTNGMGVVLAQWSGDEAMDCAFMSYDEEVVELYELNLAEYITDEGSYTLTVPAGFFDIEVEEGSAVNAEKVVTYYVSGVSGIANIIGDAAEGYNVYNVNGVNVLNTNNANDLQKLSNGFYIINGKKVIVRK